MKFDSRGIFAAVAGLALVGYLVFRVWPETDTAPALSPSTAIRPMSASPAAPPPIAEVVSSSPEKKATPAIEAAPRTEPKTTKPASRPRLTIKAGEPIPELFPNQAERDRLVKLASTYDRKNIPVIASSLRHEDATVREAARQALVQMGDAAAIPYLEEAFKSTREPEESKLIREIIEFLSLPRFSDVVTTDANATAPHP